MGLALCVLIGTAPVFAAPMRPEEYELRPKAPVAHVPAEPVGKTPAVKTLKNQPKHMTRPPREERPAFSRKRVKEWKGKKADFKIAKDALPANARKPKQTLKPAKKSKKSKKN